jgi:cytochrome c553
MKEAGKTYTKVCVQCHAADGMGKAKINKATGKPLINAMAGPRIAGLNEKYMVAQLRDIYKGARANANTISMKQKISKMKPAELKAIAHYVSEKLNHEAGSYKGMNE